MLSAIQPLIQPNWHIALVHFPVALVVVGTLVELFSFLGWRGSGFRRAGRWMLLIGAVACVPATFSGLYAWSELLQPLGGIENVRLTKPRLAEAMTSHVWTQSIATLAAVSLVVVWVALSDRWRDRLNLLFKLGLVAVSGLILWGAHSGGNAVYNNALAVEDGRPPATLPTVEEAKQLKTWEQLLPVGQSHLTMAGLAMAVAAVTLGVAIRTVHAGLDNRQLEDVHAGRIAAAFSPAADPDESVYSGVPPVEPAAVSRNYTAPQRATKFWLLSAMLLLLTSSLGLWIAAKNSEWNTNAIWDYISTPKQDGDPALTRLLAHAIVGTTLIVDTLILALIARFAPRSSVMLLVFSVPLVLAIAAQIWLGVLLQFVGPAGAVTRWGM